MERSSKALAINLRKMADWIDNKPEFPVNSTTVRVHFWALNHKEQFLEFVRAVGSGKKSLIGTDKDELRFTADSPEGTEVYADVNRNAVCRLVKPAQAAEYECEPLLSPEEEAAL